MIAESKHKKFNKKKKKKTHSNQNKEKRKSCAQRFYGKIT